MFIILRVTFMLRLFIFNFAFIVSLIRELCTNNIFVYHFRQDKLQMFCVFNFFCVVTHEIVSQFLQKLRSRVQMKSRLTSQRRHSPTLLSIHQQMLIIQPMYMVCKFASWFLTFSCSFNFQTKYQFGDCVLVLIVIVVLSTVVQLNRIDSSHRSCIDLIMFINFVDEGESGQAIHLKLLVKF